MAERSNLDDATIMASVHLEAETPGAKRHSMDSGRSWLILCAGFLINFIISGNLISVGVYFVEFIEYFDCLQSSAALVGAVMFGVANVFGIPSNILYKRLGPRVSIIAGALVSFTGVVLCYFARRIEVITIFYGIFGAGFGIMYSSLIGIQSEYFEKYLYFVMAFLTVGSALGSVVYPPFLVYLVNTYGLQGSFLVNSGIVLQMVVAGACMKGRVSHAHLKFHELFDFSLFRELNMWLVLLYFSLASGGCFVYNSFANKKMVSEGIALETSALIISLAAIASVLGRVVSSFLSHRPCVNKTFCSAAAALGIAGTVLSVTVCESVASFVAVTTVWNYAYGTMIAMFSPLLIDHFGQQRLPSAVSYAGVAAGISIGVLPPLGGVLADRGTVNDALYLSTAACSLAAITVTILYCRRRFAIRISSDEVGEYS